jgi:hypothetical protein
MRFSVVRSILSMTVSALGVVSLASCSPDTPGAADSRDGQLSTPGDAPQARALTGAGSAQQEHNESPVPPKDAQWTLLVYSVRGPAHVTDANTLKSSLIDKTKRRSWYVIHSSDESNIYFGYYRAFDDPHDPATRVAQADLQMVKDIEWPDSDGQPEKMFARAGFVSIAAPDPVAPPEWNLFNKDLDKAPKDPTRAYWSLQIMAFKTDLRRKEAAVQAVEALRKQGVEAYYYHGDTISSVCVGAWPMDAIEQQANHGEHTIADPNSTLVVYSQGVPESERASVPKFDDQGHPTVTVAPVLNILDSSMKACVAKYPFHAVNYTINRKKGTDGKWHEDPSFLVVIPRARGNGFYDSGDVTPADLASGRDPSSPDSRGHVGLLSSYGPPPSGSPGSVNADPAPPAALPGVGHLRRLGDN